VLPSVGGDKKNIYLQIIPKITSKEGDVDSVVSVTNSDGDTTPVPYSRPIFKTETIKAEAVVEDGQTVVVGGLIKDDVDDTKSHVPVLGKLPIVGNMFKSRNNRRSRSYELIFVTAQIVSPDNRHYAPVKPKKDDRKSLLNRWLGNPSKR
jgi:type II secretory pathway component GspD/PulD (secretin)